jgi:hypothetical protein
MSKPFEPTKEQRKNVEAMVGFGVSETEIARLIKNPETGEPIDAKTLRKYFSEEIDTGFTKANARVAESMYEMATKGDTSGPKLGAAAFWLARRAGWKETSTHEHVGKDGDAIRIDDARARLIHELDRVAERKRRKSNYAALTRAR